MKGFLFIVGDSINEREIRKFEEGLNSKVKHKTFNKVVEFKKYLHGKSDAGSRLMFKFRSDTHGLNEELGRHRGREGMKECLLCDDECESCVVGVSSIVVLGLRSILSCPAGEAWG